MPEWIFWLLCAVPFAVIVYQSHRIQRLDNWRVDAAAHMVAMLRDKLELENRIEELEGQLAGVKKPCGCGRNSICNCD